jgi:hypothetical protein
VDSVNQPDRYAGVGGRERADDNAALVDRIQKLRLVLPAMAQDAAVARREAAQLRRENARLQARLRELEDTVA